MKMALRSIQKRKRPGTPRLPIEKVLSRPNNSSGPEFGIRNSGLEKQSTPAAPADADAPTAPPNLPPAVDFRNETWISVKDAAWRAMKSEDTIYKWLRDGRIRGCQIGGPGCNVLVAAASLEEVLERSTRFQSQR